MKQKEPGKDGDKSSRRLGLKAAEEPEFDAG
jgi:hypothetical protein